MVCCMHPEIQRRYNGTIGGMPLPNYFSRVKLHLRYVSRSPESLVAVIIINNNSPPPWSWPSAMLVPSSQDVNSLSQDTADHKQREFSTYSHYCIRILYLPTAGHTGVQFLVNFTTTIIKIIVKPTAKVECSVICRTFFKCANQCLYFTITLYLDCLRLFP